MIYPDGRTGCVRAVILVRPTGRAGAAPGYGARADQPPSLKKLSHPTKPRRLDQTHEDQAHRPLRNRGEGPGPPQEALPGKPGPETQRGRGGGDPEGQGELPPGGGVEPGAAAAHRGRQPGGQIPGEQGGRLPSSGPGGGRYRGGGGGAEGGRGAA